MRRDFVFFFVLFSSNIHGVLAIIMPPCFIYLPKYLVPGTLVHILGGGLAVAPDADHPTLPLTRTVTRTLWGDLCLDAVACELDAVAC